MAALRWLLRQWSGKPVDLNDVVGVTVVNGDLWTNDVLDGNLIRADNDAASLGLMVYSSHASAITSTVAFC